MLKKYNQIFLGFFLIIDVLLVFLSWILAYALNFNFSPNLASSFNHHLVLSFLVVPIYFLVFKFRGLYHSMRTIPTTREIADVFKASSLATVIVVTILYFLPKRIDYFNLTFIYFWALSIFFLVVFRIIFRKTIRYFRKKGYNLRYILIVGTGDLAAEVADKLKKHLEYGFNIIGFLSHGSVEIGKSINGIKILGCYKDIKDIIGNKTVDQVIFALPAKEERLIRPILGYINTEGIDVRIILDLNGFFTLRQTIEDLEGLPVINLRESPFYGWARLIKRLIDVVFSFLAILILLPLMLLAALLIKLTSGPPVFYKQERIGLDGRRFTLFKFRTMCIDAEKHSGPTWAQENDSRITKIGAILRRSGIDESPQLFNVLFGDMSLVGPRPERPVFVEQFRNHIPQYMLRHKIQAGITGWAQIHGWRGNTSLEERIKHDLYYIEHWSVWLDIKILLLTALQC